MPESENCPAEAARDRDGARCVTVLYRGAIYEMASRMTVAELSRLPERELRAVLSVAFAWCLSDDEADRLCGMGRAASPEHALRVLE